MREIHLRARRVAMVGAIYWFIYLRGEPRTVRA